MRILTTRAGFPFLEFIVRENSFNEALFHEYILEAQFNLVAIILLSNFRHSLRSDNRLDRLSRRAIQLACQVKTTKLINSVELNFSHLLWLLQLAVIL